MATSESYTCVCCGKKKSRGNFYKSVSPLFSGIGVIPACRDCLGSLVDTYEEMYNSRRMAMMRVCVAFDIYYNDSLYALCEDSTTTIIGDYLRKLNANNSKDRSLDAALQNGTISLTAKTKDEIAEALIVRSKREVAAQEVDSDVIEKWGSGLEKSDYESLESHYKYLKSSNPDGDSNQEIFIKDLCYTNMLKMSALRDGRVDDYNKLTDQYRKTFAQAGLKTVRETATDNDLVYGVTLETIERYTPAEYYKNKKLFRDFDNLGDYVKRHMFRPLKNLQTGSDDRDAEFCVKEDEDNDFDS